MKKNLKKILRPVLTLLLLILGLGLADSQGMEDLFDLFNRALLTRDPGPAGQGQTLYRVVRVVDGDTLIIDMDGKEERVRLIGVDSPESVHPDKSKNERIGLLASSYTKRHLEGQLVSLELDQDPRDRYDRILAYVYIDGVMFNKMLLEEGLAQAKTYPPNDKYEEDFLAIQAQAQAEKRGLWAVEEVKATKAFKILDWLTTSLEELGKIITD